MTSYSSITASIALEPESSITFGSDCGPAGPATIAETYEENNFGGDALGHRKIAGRVAQS